MLDITASVVCSGTHLWKLEFSTSMTMPSSRYSTRQPGKLDSWSAEPAPPPAMPEAFWPTDDEAATGSSSEESRPTFLLSK